ncbi:MAG: CvpA family protein [Cardiobacteriaceae bacterium]|nr:CvpA family protein [Cardiobacteriaceae bacterium]
MNLESINWVDVILGGAVIISALVGIARGLIKEVLSLLTWLVAIWVAWKFSDMVAEKYVRGFIDDPTISYLAAFGALFLVTLFALGLFNMLVSSFLASSGLGGIDRMLGMVFGLLRGLIIAAVLVFVAKFVPPLTEMPAWKDSRLQPTFGAMAEWGIARLPDNVRSILHKASQPESIGIISPSVSAAAASTDADARGPVARPQTTEETQASQRQQVQNIAEIGNTGGNTGSSISLTSLEDEPPAQEQQAPAIVLESTQGQ